MHLICMVTDNSLLNFRNFYKNESSFIDVSHLFQKQIFLPVSWETPPELKTTFCVIDRHISWQILYIRLRSFEILEEREASSEIFNCLQFLEVCHKIIKCINFNIKDKYVPLSSFRNEERCVIKSLKIAIIIVLEIILRRNKQDKLSFV